MSENIYVWEVGICKSTFTEPFEKIYFIAVNFFQLSHLVALYVFGDDENDPMYDFQVEISSMTKVQNVGKIVNADFNMDGDDDEEELSDPFDIEGIPDDDLIFFKHSCNTTVKCLDNGWGFVRCPTCKEEILRSEIQNIAGTWCYIPAANKRNRKV